MSGSHAGHSGFTMHHATPGGSSTEYHDFYKPPHYIYANQEAAAGGSFYERNKEAIQCGVAGFVGGLAVGLLIMYRKK